ncbi:MAG: thiamine-phosphate synthase family protein, partial [Candidatus Micrarchaeota archaeon]
FSSARGMRVYEGERGTVVENVKRALSLVESCEGFAKLIPEIGSNIGYALRDAKSEKEVVGVVGRIRAARGRARSLGEVDFGASSHVARMIVEMMKFDERRRAAVNIAYSPEILRACEKMGLRVARVERMREPSGISGREGKSLGWATNEAVRGARARGIPDAIYYTANVGKEPSVVIFGEDAVGVARKAVRIAKLFIPRA